MTLSPDLMEPLQWIDNQHTHRYTTHAIGPYSLFQAPWRSHFAAIELNELNQILRQGLFTQLRRILALHVPTVEAENVDKVVY